ncbi:AlbA family DNA-binding domain-containing protein [Fibrella arboris]|uniref:AlbA family DNA-binding domain-containing protein n=1 Tax=Fibrella arboris TaxID=3242486 RepID=UPI003521BECC
MNSVEDLIEFESENTRLDFKAIQYKKEQFHELLKDVLAMANANSDQERLIITGVKKKPDNTFTVLPIPEGEFVDSATYQKLVADNIEPDLQIDYLPYRFKGDQLVGIFKIEPTNDKPYMMKKDFGNGDKIRKKGESFIRKGTTTLPLMRRDIDVIFEQRLDSSQFNHQIKAYFSGTNGKSTIELVPIFDLVLPSQENTKIIQGIIKEREQLKQKRAEDEERLKNTPQPKLGGIDLSWMNDYRKGFGDIDNPHISTTDLLHGFTSYQQRSTDTLKENLKNITETYADEDLVEIFNNRSQRINFTIHNEGTKYLEDTLVKIDITEADSFGIAEALYVKQFNYSVLNPVKEWDKLTFKLREKNAGLYTYNQHIGNLPHLRPHEVFEKPLRLAIFPTLIGKEISIFLTIYGKNLRRPIEHKMVIKVIDRT